MNGRAGLTALTVFSVLLYQPPIASAGTILVAPASVKGTLSASVFSATNNGTGPAIQALSVGGMALDASTASPRGLALLAENMSKTAGSAIGAFSFGNTIQATSQHANGFVGETRLAGSEAYNAAGVLGLDLTPSLSNQGVKGVSTSGAGVYGESKFGTGVLGVSDGPGGRAYNLTGVVGIGYPKSERPCALGAVGTGVQAFGIGASSASLANGWYTTMRCDYYSTGLTVDASVGVLAYGSTWADFQGVHNGIGIQAEGPQGALIIGDGSNNADSLPALEVQGGSKLIMRATSNGSVGMSLDTSGNLIISGALTQHGTPQSISTTGVTVGASFAGSENSQTIESIGEAQLVTGVSFVNFSTTFARRINPNGQYEVFLTPRGPTAGLYVAQQSLGGFTVRENPGGHSDTVFNYRIVAKALEQSSTPLQAPAGKPAHSKPMDLTMSRRMLTDLRNARARYLHGHSSLLPR